MGSSRIPHCAKIHSASQRSGSPDGGQRAEYRASQAQPHEALAADHLFLDPLQPLAGLRRIAALDVAGKLHLNCAANRFAKSRQDRRSEPVAGVLVELHSQVQARRPAILGIGQDGSLETECEHARVGIVGQMKDAPAATKIVTVVKPMFRRCLPEPLT